LNYFKNNTSNIKYYFSLFASLLAFFSNFASFLACLANFLAAISSSVFGGLLLEVSLVMYTGFSTTTTFFF